MSKRTVYKETGLSWCPFIPKDWDMKKLKYMAMVQPSNVDKKTDEKEIPVRLCNYVDVYKNDFITDDIRFMKASAKVEEIEKFKIKIGDVLITKDSETPSDIAVPALVKTESEDLICGYHLAQIRANASEIIGEYIFRVFQSKEFNSNFELAANGITRYGLSIEAIKSVSLPIPPMQTQLSIVTFLDQKITEIDNLISKKQKLIECLNEQRISIVNQAISKGLDLNVEMKQSDIEWIGDMPKDWECVKFNHYVFLRHGFQFRDKDFTSSGIKIVKITQLNPDGSLDTNNTSFIDERRLNDFKGIVIENGDILMALTGGTIGKIVRASGINEKLLQNYRVGNFFPTSKKLEKDFLFWVLSSQVILGQLFFAQRETGQPNIGKEDFSRMKFALPPVSDQIEISQYLDNENEKFDRAISKITREIELIAEYKSSLINEIVTGKISMN